MLSVFYDCHAVGDGNVGELRAVGECPGPNLFYVIRDDDAFQRRAFTECLPADISRCLDCYAIQTCAFRTNLVVAFDLFRDNKGFKFAASPKHAIDIGLYVRQCNRFHVLVFVERAKIGRPDIPAEYDLVRSPVDFDFFGNNIVFPFGIYQLKRFCLV